MDNGHKLRQPICAHYGDGLTNIETAGLSYSCDSCLASTAREVVSLEDGLSQITVLGGMRRSFELYFSPFNSSTIVG